MPAIRKPFELNEVQRQRRNIDLSAEVGGLAEMSEVGGKAVAQVDSGGGETPAKERSSGSEAWLRKEMRVDAQDSYS